MKNYMLLLIFLGGFAANAAAEDCWLSVHGSGLQNGSSADNAYSAENGKAQKCWNQTTADGTMHVLAGHYKDDAFWRLRIDAEHGGKSGAYKTLLGHGKVIIEGTRDIPYPPGGQLGESWIEILWQVSNIKIQNFNVWRVKDGIRAVWGENKKIWLKNLSFRDTQQNIVIDGHPACKSEAVCIDEDKLSKDILIENTEGLRYSKRHVRLGKGVSHVIVKNSHADAAFLDGDFAVGFDVENPSHDILFSHCTARRNIHSKSEYWNGDGFKSENETYNIRWEHCEAYENGDAGFDIKTRGASLLNIIARQNARNIRTWDPETAVLKEIEASDSKHWGGEGTEAGIWTQGNLDCHSCKLRDNHIQAQTEKNAGPSKINFYDSELKITPARKGAEFVRQEDGTQINFIRTNLLQEKGAK